MPDELFSVTIKVVWFVARAVLTVVLGVVFLFSLLVPTAAYENIVSLIRIESWHWNEVLLTMALAGARSVFDLLLVWPSVLVTVLTLVRLPMLFGLAQAALSSPAAERKGFHIRLALCNNAFDAVVGILLGLPALFLAIFSPWLWTSAWEAVRAWFSWPSDEQDSVRWNAVISLVASSVLGLLEAIFGGLFFLIVALLPWRWGRVREVWAEIRDRDHDEDVPRFVYCALYACYFFLLALADLAILVICALLSLAGVYRLVFALRNWYALDKDDRQAGILQPLTFHVLVLIEAAYLLWDLVVLLPAAMILPTHRSFLCLRDWQRGERENPRLLIVKHALMLCFEILLVLPCLLLLVLTVYRAILLRNYGRTLDSVQSTGATLFSRWHWLIIQSAAAVMCELFVMPLMLLGLALFGYRLPLVWRDVQSLDAERFGVLLTVVRQFFLLLCDIPFIVLALLAALLCPHRWPVMWYDWRAIRRTRFVLDDEHDEPGKAGKAATTASYSASSSASSLEQRQQQQRQQLLSIEFDSRKAAYRAFAIHHVVHMLASLALVPLVLLLLVCGAYRFVCAILDLVQFAHDYADADVTSAERVDALNSWFDERPRPALDRAPLVVLWETLCLLEDLLCLILMLVMLVLPWHVFVAARVLATPDDEQYRIEALVLWSRFMRRVWARKWAPAALSSTICRVALSQKKLVQKSSFVDHSEFLAAENVLFYAADLQGSVLVDALRKSHLRAATLGVKHYAARAAAIEAALADSAEQQLSASATSSSAAGSCSSAASPVSASSASLTSGSLTSSSSAASSSSLPSSTSQASKSSAPPSSTLKKASTELETGSDTSSSLASLTRTTSDTTGTSSGSASSLVSVEFFEQKSDATGQALIDYLNGPLYEAWHAVGEHMHNHKQVLGRSPCCDLVPVAFERTRLVSPSRSIVGNILLVGPVFADFLIDLLALLGGLLIMLSVVRLIPLIRDGARNRRAGLRLRTAVFEQLWQLAIDLGYLAIFLLLTLSIVCTASVTILTVHGLYTAGVRGGREGILLTCTMLTSALGLLGSLVIGVICSFDLYLAIVFSSFWTPVAMVELTWRALHAIIMVPAAELVSTCPPCFYAAKSFVMLLPPVLVAAPFVAPLVGILGFLAKQHKWQTRGSAYDLTLAATLSLLGVWLVVVLVSGLVRAVRLSGKFHRPHALFWGSSSNKLVACSQLLGVLQLLALALCLWNPLEQHGENFQLVVLRLGIPLSSDAGFWLVVALAGVLFILGGAAVVDEAGWLPGRDNRPGALVHHATWRSLMTLLHSPGLGLVAYSALREVSCEWDAPSRRWLLRYMPHVVCFAGQHTVRAVCALVLLVFFAGFLSVMQAGVPDGDGKFARLSYRLPVAQKLAWTLLVLVLCTFVILHVPSADQAVLGRACAIAVGCYALLLLALMATHALWKPAAVHFVTVVFAGLFFLAAGPLADGPRAAIRPAAVRLLAIGAGAAVLVGLAIGVLEYSIAQYNARYAAVRRLRDVADELAAIEAEARRTPNVLSPDWLNNGRERRAFVTALEEARWYGSRKVLVACYAMLDDTFRTGAYYAPVSLYPVSWRSASTVFASVLHDWQEIVDFAQPASWSSAMACYARPYVESEDNEDDEAPPASGSFDTDGLDKHEHALLLERLDELRAYLVAHNTHTHSLQSIILMAART